MIKKHEHTEKLNITAICVTLNNGKMLKYSIESMVNYIDEILIFDDDNFDNNYYLKDLSKHINVKIIKRNLGTQLGEKKQYLNEIAKHNIILRWDNDFILYDYNVLFKVYNLFINGEIDAAYNFNNMNLKFSIDKVDYTNPFCREAYLFRKGYIKFGKYGNYNDFPIIIGNKMKLRSFENEILFVHLSNFKSYENLIFRRNMGPFFNSNYKNYYEYLFTLRYPNKKYNYFDIINLKRDLLLVIKKQIYEYNNNNTDHPSLFEYITKLKNTDIGYIPNNLGDNLIDYLNKNYKLIKINDSPEQYNYICNQTDNLTKIFYWYSTGCSKGNFGDILAYYIFEKITGYTHEHYDIRNNENNDFHYVTIGSIINKVTEKSIVWGSGTIASKMNKINPYKIYCVRGPRTRKVLREQNINIPEIYGDPALLMPIIYNRHVDKKIKIGIIPHIIDYDDVVKLFGNNNEISIFNLAICPTYESIEQTIDNILSCEFILSSSLHGIIIANAYNIPVIRFKGKQLAGDDIKFIDYFESIYSDGYICESSKNIKDIINNFEDIKKIYKVPDMIMKRQIDLITSCPFIDNSLKQLLIKSHCL